MSLVFAYDMSNDKSWKGRPTTNYLVTSSWGQSFCMGRADKRPFNSTSHSANGRIVQGTGFTFTPGASQNIPEKPVEDSEIWYVRDSNPDHYSRFSPFNGMNTTNDLPSYDVSYVVSSYVYIPPNITLGNANNFVMAQNNTGTDWHTGGDFTQATYNTSFNYWARRIEGTQVKSDTNVRGSWQRQYMTFQTYSATVTQEVGVTIDRLGGYMRPNMVGQSQENYYFVAASQLELGTTPSPYVYGSRSNTEALVDIAGNNTITLQNMTYNADNTFSFDGVNDYISVTSNTMASSSASLSCWVYIDDFTTGKTSPGRVLTRLSSSTFTSLIAFYNGGFAFETLTNSNPHELSGRSVPAISSSDITSGSWFHFSLVFDSGTAYAYANGKPIGSVAISNDVAIDRIGDGTGFSDGYPAFMKGKISEFYLYDNPLTSQQVADFYQSSKYKYL